MSFAKVTSYDNFFLYEAAVGQKQYTEKKKKLSEKKAKESCPGRGIAEVASRKEVGNRNSITAAASPWCNDSHWAPAKIYDGWGSLRNMT